MVIVLFVRAVCFLHSGQQQEVACGSHALEACVKAGVQVLTGMGFYVQCVVGPSEAD